MYGRFGVYQSAGTLCGMIRKNPPNDDWCRNESTMPAITRGKVKNFKIFRSSRQLEPLKERRSELERQDRGVERDAHHDLEHDRADVPHDQGMPEAERFPDVDDEPHDHHGIADEGREDGRPGDGLVFLHVEDVDRGGDAEAAGGQGHAREHVHGDPEAPGHVVGQVRRCAEPDREPVEGRGGNADSDQRQKRLETCCRRR